MLETPNYSSIISSYIKTYTTPIIVVVILAAGYQGWRMYQKHLITKQTQLELQNKELEGKISILTKDYNTLALQKKDLETVNVQLDTDAQYWKKKAAETHVTPPPPPPPQDDATLLANLKDAGAEFKILKGTTFSTEHSTLPLVWTWNKQSLRVPELELKVVNTKESADRFEAETLGLKKEKFVSDDMLKKADERELDRIKQEANFKEQVSTIKKEVKAAEINGWLKFGGALFTGYVVGKQIKK
jgi:hypothetical protein